MDLDLPPDLYGRPRADRYLSRLTAFADWLDPRFGGPGLRRNPKRPAARPVPPLQLVVASHRLIADGVAELRLADPGGSPLPGWQPGARLELTLPSGLVRHYSLCGDPSDRRSYRIAVRRIPEGGGGSVEVHDALHPGVRLTARRPRNGFAFCAEPTVLLLAGGIGVTPILPMAHQAEQLGLDWKLVYAGRDEASMPFLSELRALGAGSDRVEVLTGPPAPVEELLARARPGSAVYCCGPTPMLAAVQRALDASPAASLHFERFGAAPIVDGRPFTVRLGDGPELTVPADRSALDVLREQNPALAYSCHQGFCGTCRLRVTSGTPAHRDRRLTPEDRAAGAFLPCVSRAPEGEHLTLTEDR